MSCHGHMQQAANQIGKAIHQMRVTAEIHCTIEELGAIMTYLRQYRAEHKGER